VFTKIVNRIFKAKRSIQSNEEKPQEGKLLINRGLFSSNVTEAAGKKEDSDKKSQTGSIFNFSNAATAGGA